ncbi:hypothetical protein [Botrimarina sp.]|uniref:hypothetical protein n=1 Tax=Botrimarina sp. TaxID=2795802 RepID=UPI0032EAF960
MLKLRSTLSPAALIAAATIAVGGAPASAQVTPVFYDGFNVSEAGGTTSGVSSFNINEEIGTPRQGGPFVPVSYVTTTPDASNSFAHQLFPPSNGAQPLQIAENGSNPPNGTPPIFSYKTMVSPDFNFDGVVDAGVVGKRISFTLDVGVIAEEGFPGSGTFTQAGITIGAPTTLIDSEDQVGVQEGLPIRDYFSIHFVEDNLAGGLGSFMQAFADGFIIQDEGNSGVVVDHMAGDGLLAVQLDIDDPADGNPWDGIGSTVIDVSVNGLPVYSYEKADGGYTDNYITLFGSRQFAGNALAVHTFDDFTVFAAPTEAVPADYNFDGQVNAADYTVFRDSEGESISLPGENPDAITPGLVDAEDYAFWASNYGATAGGATAVPEPSAAALVGFALLAGVRRGKA